MGMRFYEAEDWFDAWRWYHWLLLLVALWGLGWLGSVLGWIETPPPEGQNPRARTEVEAPQR